MDDDAKQKKRQAALEAARRQERERILRVFDGFRADLEAAKLYVPIRNRIADPDYDPFDREDRLDGF